MKRTLAAIGVAFALTACGGGNPEPGKAASAPPTVAVAPATVVAPAALPSPAADASRKFLDEYLAAWNAHDQQAVGALFADDIEYFDAGFSGIQRGREAALDNGVGVFMRGVPDLHWELRGDPVVGAGAVAWEWTLTGTHTGTWGGVAATRQSIILKGVSVLRLRGGRISQVSIYYDSGTLNRQLGL